MTESAEPLDLSRSLPSEPKASILLVDGKPANLLSLRALLDGLGLTVVEARSGEEAIERVKTNEFAVILLDVLLPGISGFETAKAIRGQQQSQHTPIIFLTASDLGRAQMEEGYALGAVDFLVKPLMSVAVQAKVRGFVQLFQDKERTRHEAHQLRLLVHGTTEYAIFMLDSQGYVVTWNAGAERIKGYKADEIIGQHFSRFYPQDAISRGWPQHELEVASREGRFEDEGWRIRKDGSRLWANVVITALKDDRGRLLGFSKVTRDLTARRQAEEALRRSEERFRLLVDTAKDYAIFMLNPQGNIASWNPGAERIKGYKADEIIGQHFSKFYPQEVIDRGWPAYELKVAQAEGRFEDEGWRVRKDGTQFWANVVITALHDEAGEFVGFSKITRDLTDRKRSEENARRLAEEAAGRRVAEGNARLIQEQRERLHVTLASIGDGVISTDAQGQVDFLNPVAENLLGWKSEEVARRTLEDVFRIVNEDTRQPVPNPALRALKEGVIVGLANHTVLIARDGRELPIDDSAAPIRDAGGSVVGSVLVFRDISERKRNEAALKERVRLLSLSAAVGAALVQADGLAGMLQRCAEALVIHLDGAFARIWTLNPQDDVLELRASAGLYTHLDGPHSRVPVGKYKIGLIAQERQPHLTNKVVGDPRVGDQEWARREGMIAFAGYPLVVDDRLVGVTAMFARKALSETTLAAMAAVADEIAVGIDRKATEERLHEQREWLAVTLASIGDAVITTDEAGRVTFLNGVAQELTGWTPDSAKGQPLETVFIIVNERTQQPVENPVDMVLRDGVIVGLGNHTILVSKDGTKRPIDDSAAPIRDAVGRMIGVVLIFRDVAEQRRAEREVRQSEARKSAILETALDCIITMDHEGNVVEFNPAAEKTFGYRREQVVGRELADFIIPPTVRERHRRGMAHFLATGEGPLLGKRLVLPALRADGTEFPAEVAITRILTDGPPLFTAYLRDISEPKRAEQHRNARLAVTHALSEADNVEEGASAVLQGVCENLGWDVGFFWTVNDANGTLACQRSWHRPDVSVEEFETASRSRTFKPGEGLPGRVWAGRKPAWILDIAHDANFTRLATATKYGLQSAFASPVVIGDRTLGVVEFFTSRLREPDADLLEMMGTMAGNVGQFIERKAAEEELRQREQELADFFENATIGLHWVGPDGIVLRANRAELEMLGYSREEYVGRPIADFHADDHVICDILKRLQAGENLAEYPARLRCKDGSIKDVLIDSSVLFKDGKFVHTRCFTRDMTERNRAEAALRRSEQKARFLAQASAALASLVDYESTLQKVANLAVPYFADWSAVDVADAGSLRRLAVAHKDPGKIELAHQLVRDYPLEPQVPVGTVAVFRSGKPEIVRDITDDLLVQGAKDERHRTLIRSLGLKSYICVPLVVSGNTLGVLTFATAESGRIYTDADLALAVDLVNRAAVAVENTQLYQALRETDRRKDEFLATLAHELRNPLAPIRNALQILKMPRVGAEMVSRSRDMMERQVDQLVRLVDDLLDVSRVMRGKIELRRERIELATVVARAVETVQPLVDAQGHHLSVSLSPESLPIDVDPVRLTQVVGNLLTNAAKYTEPHGRIWLTAEREGDMAVLRVRDTGIGIDPVMLPRIFELFVQVDHASTKAQGGLGIGLTLVKNLVEMHNGTVEARSEGLGRGSEFVVKLPLVAQEVGSDQAGQTGRKVIPPPAASGYRLLVVDDNHDAADSLAMLLKLQGHEVRVAFSGMAALEMTKDYTPDVVFLDIGMPGMDGYEVARRMRQQPGLEKALLAALTGWGQKEDRRRTAEAGFNYHLVKPPDPQAVEGLLAALPKRH